MTMWPSTPIAHGCTPTTITSTTTTCCCLQVLGLLMHANHLEREYGAGPHTLSVPRMRPADGSDVSALQCSGGGGASGRESPHCLPACSLAGCQHACCCCVSSVCQAASEGHTTAHPPEAVCPLASPPPIACPRQVSLAPPHAVDDANFKKLVAILRIAVPYTGMILRQAGEGGWGRGCLGAVWIGRVREAASQAASQQALGGRRGL